LEQLDALIARGVLGARRVKEMLAVVWASPGIWTFEETERIMQTAEDLEALEMEEVYQESGCIHNQLLDSVDI
jgi:hypothetical protein